MESIDWEKLILRKLKQSTEMNQNEFGSWDVGLTPGEKIFPLSFFFKKLWLFELELHFNKFQGEFTEEKIFFLLENGKNILILYFVLEKYRPNNQIQTGKNIVLR